MKKIINFVLIACLSLFFSECTVENIVPQQVKSAFLKNENIKTPFVWKANVYQIKLGAGTKIEKTANNQITITGDYQVVNTKARVLADDPPVGAIVLIEVSTNSENGQSFFAKIFDKTKFSGGIKITYQEIDWHEGLNEGEGSFEMKVNTNFEIEQEVTTNSFELIKKRNGISKINLNVLGKKIMNIVGTLKMSIKMENGRLKYFNSEFIYDSNFLNTLTFSGEIEGEFIAHIGAIILPDITLTLGPLPLKVTPVLKLNFRVEGEASIDASIGLSKGNYKYQMDILYENGAFAPLKTKTLNDKVDYFYTLSGALTGNIKVGLELESILSFYRFGPDLDAGNIGWKTFTYAGISADCGINVPEGQVFNYIRGIKIKPALEILKIKVDQSIPFEFNLEQKIPSIIGSGLNCGNPPLLNTKGEFVELLKSYNFPINEGLNAPILNGRYISNPHTLENSSLKADLVGSDFGKLEFFIDILVNSKLVEIVQIDKNNRDLSIETNQDIKNDITITGSGGNFTIIGKTNGYAPGTRNEFDNYFAISGYKTSTGISNFHYALYRIKNVKSAQDNLPVGKLRIFKDGDNLAQNN